MFTSLNSYLSRNGGAVYVPREGNDGMDTFVSQLNSRMRSIDADEMRVRQRLAHSTEQSSEIRDLSHQFAATKSRLLKSFPNPTQDELEDVCRETIARNKQRYQELTNDMYLPAQPVPTARPTPERPIPSMPPPHDMQVFGSLPVHSGEPASHQIAMDDPAMMVQPEGLPPVVEAEATPTPVLARDVCREEKERRPRRRRVRSVGPREPQGSVNSRLARVALRRNQTRYRETLDSIRKLRGSG